MALYFTIFFILTFFAWVQINDSRNRAVFRSLLIVTLIIFAALSAFRWESGTDWEPYIELFKRVNYWSDIFEIVNIEFESGFLALNLLSHKLSSSYTLCLLLQSCIIFLFLYKSLQKESISPFCSLMIYFSMSVAGIFFVRQTIALSILLYSTQYIVSRRFKTFLLFIFLASLFHRTAWFYLLAYPTYCWHLSWKRIVIMLLCCIVMGLTSSRLLLMILGNMDLGIVGGKLNAYLTMGSDDNSTIYSTTGTILRATFNRGILFFFYWAFLKKLRATNAYLNGLININVVGACLYFLLAPVALSLARVTAYFDIIQILIIPFFFLDKRIANRAVNFSVIVVYSLFRLYVALSAHPGAYIPYKSIFSH